MCILWSVRSHQWMNAVILIFCIPFFLDTAYVCVSQSTDSKCSLVYFVFVNMYSVRGDPCRSLIICRFNLDVFVMPPDLKATWTCSDMSGFDIGRKSLYLVSYMASACLVQSMFNSAAWFSGISLPSSYFFLSAFSSWWALTWHHSICILCLSRSTLHCFFIFLMS